MPKFGPCPAGILGNVPGSVTVDGTQQKFALGYLPAVDEIEDLIGNAFLAPFGLIFDAFAPLVCATAKTRSDSFVTFRPPAPRFRDPVRAVPGTDPVPEDRRRRRSRRWAAAGGRRGDDRRRPGRALLRHAGRRRADPARHDPRRSRR